MRIHGLVYLVLGILMSLYARFIQSQVEKNSMVIFFWIGVVFIGIGVFRLIIDYILKKKEKKADISSLEKLKREKEQFFDQEKKKEVPSNNIISCQNCGTKHYSNSNFCHMCGQRLK